MKKAFYCLCCLILVSCEKTYFGKNAPLVTASFGIWKLEKIVSPSRTILANELGYEQLIQIEPNGSTNNFYVFKDRKLESTYSFGRISNEIDKKDKVYFEVNMGIKLVKMEILAAEDGSLMDLVMSDFLYDSQAQADTVRFHYSHYASSRNW